MVSLMPRRTLNKHSGCTKFLKWEEFPQIIAGVSRLKKITIMRYWGVHLQARGYWVTSSANVTGED